MADAHVACKAALLRSGPFRNWGTFLGELQQARRSIRVARAGWLLGLVWLLAVPLVGTAQARPPERFDTVVIDAGHGGEDSGALGARGTAEKDVVLAVAIRLAKALRAHGFHVVMTRDSDVFVPLERRNALANDARADLFISIHANAAKDPSVHGTETYFLALDASDESAARVAARENQPFEAAGESALAAMQDPFIALLGDLISTEYLAESSEVAGLIQKELGEIPNMRSRGVKQALFVVLSGVQMPAALVEIGFVTSPDDQKRLSQSETRGAVVKSIERAVLAFGRRYDARRNDAPAPGNR
jgi:N-acetylmuramoyl-L-alanine amidase